MRKKAINPVTKSVAKRIETQKPKTDKSLKNNPVKLRKVDLRIMQLSDTVCIVGLYVKKGTAKKARFDEAYILQVPPLTCLFDKAQNGLNDEDILTKIEGFISFNYNDHEFIKCDMNNWDEKIY